MTACSTCAHWSPKANAVYAKLRLAICLLGPRWQFNAPHHTCERHSPASPEIAQARAIWLAKK